MNLNAATTNSTIAFARCRRSARAFTLIEMLLVITIIALLAGIGLPHLKGWGDANTMTAATRQLMDDLAYARLKAISTRSSVYVVFISPTVVNQTFFDALPPAQQKQASNLFNGQYTTYALFSPHSVGDQPGRDTIKYLTPWKSLPDKIFVATNKFSGTASENARLSISETSRPFRYMAIPFPSKDSPSSVFLPCILFDSQGRLVSEKNSSGGYEGATIPLARGSIFYARNAEGEPVLGPADAIETPSQNSVSNKNWVRIDWLTGRARVEREIIQ